MSSPTITLARSDEEWVEAQVESGVYSDGDQYVGELIRRDREQRLNELREHVRLSFESGISDRRVSDVIAAAKRRYEANR